MGYYTTTIQKGSQGDEVKKWQEFLNSQGYDFSEYGGIDGIFGTGTDLYTRDWQEKHGIGADGIVGDKTWGAAGFKLSPSSQDFKYDDFSYDDFKYDDFAYDDYKESDTVKNAGAALDSHLANKPGEYQSKWQANIDALMDKILNREEFSYDLNADALYNQYKDQYMQQGKLAMQDTMGQAAAMTGGYGNSYAATVGNQAYQAYLGKLNDIVPELYQMALDKYTRDGENLYNQYGMLSDRENLDYGRYRDTLSDYLAERDYLAGRYDSERDYDYSKYNNERGFAYDKYADAKYQKSKTINQDDQDDLDILDSLPSLKDDVNDQPVDDQPVDDQPVDDQPVDDQPVDSNYKQAEKDISDVIKNGTTADGNPVTISSLFGYIKALKSEGYITSQEKTKLMNYALNNLKFSVVSNGSSNLMGVDKDAIIKLPGSGENKELKEFIDYLEDQGMDRSEAKKYVKNLQQQLGISRSDKPTAYTEGTLSSYLSDPTKWEVVNDGRFNWFGIDADAEVKAPDGKTYTLMDLRNVLDSEGMKWTEAHKAIKRLQKALGISGPKLF